jgi:hypothetical protein
MKSDRFTLLPPAAISVVFVALLAAAAQAQETTGAVFGAVRSADGVALPGATVTIENPATGLRIPATADDRGEFRFLALPPASYVLEVSLDGFRTHRQNLFLALGQTLKCAVELELGSYSEAIEVTAERSPVVDVTSTVTGLTVGVGELNDRVPVQREVTQVALLAAGTLPGDTAFDGRTPGQRLASISGASVAENLYVVNGLNITNFREMLGSSRVPFAFLDEVQVKTGGWEAEFGRSTGGVINMVTRSGGNDTRGDVSVYYQPEALQGTDPNTEVVPEEDESWESLEANASLGGALVRDRLFYYLFASYEDSDRLSLYATPSQLIPIVDRYESAQPLWGGKVDWTPSSGHRLEGTYFTDRADVDLTRGQDAEQLYELGRTGVEERGGDNVILRYSGVLGERALLSLQAGRNEFARSNRSSGDECPAAVDRRSGRAVIVGCWFNVTIGTADDIREAYRADLDYVAGGHSLRAGVDWESSVSEDDTSYSGGVAYQYYLNGKRFPQLPAATELALEAYQSRGGSFETISGAAYVQDSWAASPTLTLNLACAGSATTTATAWARRSSRPTTSTPRGSGSCGTRRATAARRCTPATASTTCRSPRTPTSGSRARSTRRTAGTSCRGGSTRTGARPVWASSCSTR